MARFSEKSRERLLTCEPRLQRICEVAVRVMDFTVLEGHREKEAQEKAFAEGKSKLQWPNSGHNTVPAIAVDLAPYPLDWADTLRFHQLAGVMKGVAAALNIKIRWGGDFKGLIDMPHFELIGDDHV